MVGHRQVEAAENCSTGEQIESFVESRNRKNLELRNRIKSAEIDAHPPITIILMHNHDR